MQHKVNKNKAADTIGRSLLNTCTCVDLEGFEVRQVTSLDSTVQGRPVLAVRRTF